MIRGERAGGHITRGIGGKIGWMTDEVVLFKDWVPMCRSLCSCVLSIKGRRCPVVPRPFASLGERMEASETARAPTRSWTPQGSLYHLKGFHDLIITRR